MPGDLAPLHAEVAAWAAAGLALPLWLRDDDATVPGPALDRLIDAAAGWGLPLHLAVIPAGATPSLAARLAAAPAVRVLVHGWAHANHEAPGAKKAEFGAARPAALALAEAGQGLRRLRGLCGPAVLPVFVPPWNRIAPEVAAGLPGAGYAALSAVPRAAPAVAGLRRIDAELDPVDWHGTRSALPAAEVARRAAAALAERRRAGSAPPLGLLTHHLVHDPAIWALTDRLVRALLPIARPLDLADAALTEATP